MESQKLQEGVLCNLKIGKWSASTKLPKSKLGKDIPREIIRAMQDLVEDKTLLKNIATIRRMTKGELMRNSIPFPIDGVWFVPKENIDYLDDQFKQFKKENDKRVNDFLRAYKKLKVRMKAKYPDYYNPSKYPTEAELRAKYYFNWQFFHINLPNGKASILSPKVYKREQEKFQKMIQQMEEMTITLVAQRLFRRIDRLSQQCNNGKVNAGTVNSVDRFLNKWDELWSGYVDEKHIRLIMAQLRGQMKKVSADRLKDSEQLRDIVGNKLDSLIDKLKIIPNVNLKRRIDI